jgi:hypothetical protein
MDLKELTSPQKYQFYSEALKILNQSEIPYLVGGGLAVHIYAGIQREVHDLDIFCKAGDAQRIMKLFMDKEFQSQVIDPRWISKVYKNDDFVDLIFNSVNSLCPVDDSWFTHAQDKELFGVNTKVVGPEELIWCKIYIQDRTHFDWPDINHLILKQGKNIDWKHVLNRLEQHWPLLLGGLLNFRFVYPFDIEIVPKWLMEELIERLKDQIDLPAMQGQVCLGPLLSQRDYVVDVEQWGYKTVNMYLDR